MSLSQTSSGRLVLEHGVERRPADLRELADLGLRDALVECLPGEAGDGLRLGLRGLSGPGALSPVGLERAAKIIHTASVK